MLAQDHRHLAVVEGVLQLDALEGVPAPVADHVIVLDAVAVHGVPQQSLGDDQALAAVDAVGLHHHVLQLRIEGDRLVGGQGPGGGGPDHHGHRAVPMAVRHRVAAREDGFLVQHPEAYVDGDGFLVRVFHLRLCQGRAAVDAPVHRLVALVHVAVGDDAAQSANDVGLEAEVHGEVGVIPVAQHSQTLEVLSLAVHLPSRIFAAGLAELSRADLGAGLALLLLHLQLDGQAVAVPAGDIGRVHAVQGSGLDDDVLQDLVDRMADVDLPVGVGRAVVQDELLPSPPLRCGSGRRGPFPPSA